MHHGAPPTARKRAGTLSVTTVLFAVLLIGMALLGQLHFCSEFGVGFGTRAKTMMELQRLRNAEKKMYELESEIEFIIELGKLRGVDLSSYRNTKDKHATLGSLRPRLRSPSGNAAGTFDGEDRINGSAVAGHQNRTRHENKTLLSAYEETTSWLVAETPFGSNDGVYDIVPRYAVTAGATYTRWMEDRFREKGGRYWNTTRKTEGTEKIKRIWIWGERNSCTSVVTELIRKNFNLECGNDGPAPGGAQKDKNKSKVLEVDCVIGGLPWKHDFVRRADFSKQDSTLNILVTRHPYEWLSSMKRHPFYAHLHYNMPSMEAFLLREWVSFQVGKGAPKPKGGRSSKMTWAGLATKTNHSCITNKRLLPGETCLLSETLYECTSLPGMDSSLWQHYNNEISIPNCENAETSASYCVGAFLCLWKNSSRPWWTDFDAWQRLVEKIIHTAPDFENSVAGVASLEPGSAHSVKYECIPVPGYRNSLGDELAPSMSCLDGRKSWNKCKAGKFLCVNKDKQLWVTHRNVWNSLRKILESANKHFHSKDEKHTNFKAAPRLAAGELLQDRDPDTLERFPNILAMREAKIMDWMFISDQMYNFSSHIACREFFLDPAVVLERLQQTFGLARRSPGGGWDLSQCEMVHGVSFCKNSKGKKVASDWNEAKMVEKRNFYLSGKFMQDFTQDALDIANAWLSPDLEAALGYELVNDLTLASAPYDPISRCTVHRPYNAPMSAACLTEFKHKAEAASR